jgi:hypothetical protein
MPNRRKRMHITHAGMLPEGFGIRFPRSLRRVRSSRDDTAYLLGNPETARRLLAAMADSRAGRMIECSLGDLRAMLPDGPQR